MPIIKTFTRLAQNVGIAGAGRHSGGKMKPVPKGGKLQRTLRRNQLEHNKLMSLGIDLRKLPKDQKKENEQARRRLKTEGTLPKPWKDEKREKENNDVA